MKIVWTNHARERLFEIEDYIISQGAPANAEHIIQRLIDRAKILIEFPNSGRIVPEYPSGDYRELIEASYRIVLIVRRHLGMFI